MGTRKRDRVEVCGPDHQKTSHEEAQLVLYARAAEFAGSGYASEEQRVALEKAAVVFVRERNEAGVRGYGQTAATKRRIRAQRTACGV